MPWPHRLVEMMISVLLLHLQSRNHSITLQRDIHRFTCEMRRLRRRLAWSGDLDARLDLLKATLQQPSAARPVDNDAPTKIMQLASTLAIEAQQRKRQRLRRLSTLIIFITITAVVIHGSINNSYSVVQAVPVLALIVREVMLSPLLSYHRAAKSRRAMRLKQKEHQS
ncbi:hypothetical protein ACWGIU_26910 [Streptomyces sp. NPDC054840]